MTALAEKRSATSRAVGAGLFKLDATGDELCGFCIEEDELGITTTTTIETPDD